MSDFFGNSGQFADVTNAVLRFCFPVLALLILARCVRSLLLFRKEPEIWGWLIGPDGTRYPVTHWETLVGRAKTCDVVLNYPTISRTHAVLTRYDDGSWTISDVGSKGGIRVNNAPVSIGEVVYGDVISIGGVMFRLQPITKMQEQMQAANRTKAGSGTWSSVTLILLTIFQLLAGFQLSMEDTFGIFPAFFILIGLEWALYIFTKILRRSGFEVETIAFFLTTLGMSVIASGAPQELIKQIICIVAGIALYLLICWSLRDLERAKKLRYVAAAASIGLLAFNLVFGVEMYGAKNWIMIGGFSFQPSELVKLCFIFTGASTLQRIMTKRNMILFIAYSAVVCGCLVLLNDFGTALIFFTAFLTIAYMRSGSFATIALIIAATAMAAVMAFQFVPHIIDRFSAWGNVWEHAQDTGYQQTRAMMCIASGGLFGLGVGRGWLHYVGASDTDLIFAFIAEEWGLLMSIFMVLFLICLAAFVIRSSVLSRSSYYTISACAAAAILLVQMILNIFGTVDLLPLTGVTFPFVSNGGSSMIACWGLLAFIKAADTRQNASMAIKLTSKNPEEM